MHFLTFSAAKNSNSSNEPQQNFDRCKFAEKCVNQGRLYFLTFSYFECTWILVQENNEDDKINIFTHFQKEVKSSTQMVQFSNPMLTNCVHVFEGCSVRFEFFFKTL